MRVVIAPDKFRGSLTAAEACAAIAAGVRTAEPTATLYLFELADGGEGTVAAAIGAGYSRHNVIVRGPTGRPGSGTVATRDGTAVIELADCCGLQRLPEGVLEPMHSSTYGLGQALRSALDLGATTIVLAVGGSASTDGGLGLISALGAVAVDHDGNAVAHDASGLQAAVDIRLAGLDPRLRTARLLVATDVDNPLHGPTGAACVYAPQKGATPEQVAWLDLGLRRWADVLARKSGRSVAALPGAGAAGGVPAAAVALLGARVTAGSALIQELTGVLAEARNADLVITGEGRLDEQSLSGKGPIALARRCAKEGVPVLAVAGAITVPPERLTASGLRDWLSLRALASSADESMANAAELVERATTRVVQRFAASAGLCEPPR